MEQRSRLDEGDKGWIVEERPDGMNVHYWHWSERYCLEWSRSLLSSLLYDLEILNSEGQLYIHTKAIDKGECEAYVNARKGKVIPGYELSIKLVTKEKDEKEYIRFFFDKVFYSESEQLDVYKFLALSIVEDTHSLTE